MNNKIIFIPIKEHSSRVSRKNFRYFSGVPLYIHTLNKYVNKEVVVYVDTDSDEILKNIEDMHSDKKMLNIHAYERSKHLRGDDVSVNLLIHNFIDYIDLDYNKSLTTWIAQIHVTSPFLSANTVMSAFDKIESDETIDSLASVTEHQSRFWRMDTYGYCPVNHNPMKLEKTQDLPKLYEENSCFYIFNSNNFLKFGGYRVGKNPGFMTLDFPENLDIDTESDMDRCLSLSGIYN